MPKTITVDMRTEQYKQEAVEVMRCKKLCFKLNNLEPDSPQLRPVLNDLFANRLPEDSTILLPTQIDRANMITIGKNVFINHSFNCVAIGGISIEDNVMIAQGVTIITANHHYEDRDLLDVTPVHIKRNAWIGARSVIIPGITIGENAVVAAGSVVTKDVPDNTVVGGNPARIIKNVEKVEEVNHAN